MYQDIVYMRFMAKGRVIRVARADTQRGLVLALYPSEDKDIFYTEAFQEIDDISPKRKIQRSKLKDDIWLRLLDRESHETILADYELESYCKKRGISSKSFKF